MTCQWPTLSSENAKCELCKQAVMREKIYCLTKVAIVFVVQGPSESRIFRFVCAHQEIADF